MVSKDFAEERFPLTLAIIAYVVAEQPRALVRSLGLVIARTRFMSIIYYKMFFMSTILD
jgi:hypothetical protein